MVSFRSGWSVADQICRLVGVPVYIALGRAGRERALQTWGSWAVNEDLFSSAPSVANRKLLEVFVGGSSQGLSLTPLPVQISLGWQGGVRFDEHLVAVSGWRQEHDRLLAMTVLWQQMGNSVRLHHVGFRHPTHEAMLLASGRTFGDAIPCPAADHKRVYHPQAVQWSGKGKVIFVEHQFFEDGPKDPAIHWDVVTPDPVGFLRFVAGAFGAEPRLFTEPGNGPVGVVWVKASRDDSVMGVMARSRWWIPRTK